MCSGFLENMKEQYFGVEIELTGIRVFEVRRILAEYFNNEDLLDFEGRDWDVRRDSSICGMMWIDGSLEYAPFEEYGVEVVTPILGYNDIGLVQDVLRLISAAGGVASGEYLCGLHIHIGDEGHTQNTLRNLIRLFNSKQYLIRRALNIPCERVLHYCKFVNDDLAARCERRFQDIHELTKVWLDTSNRYRMLNFSSLFIGKGIELRCFNSTLDGDAVKAYIQFSLAVVQSSKSLSRVCSREPKNNQNDRYSMRLWLCRLHLNGAEFKDCRRVMTKNLSGDAAFSDPNARKELEISC